MGASGATGTSGATGATGAMGAIGALSRALFCVTGAMAKALNAENS